MGLPGGLPDDAATVAKRWTEDLLAAGYDIHGDLDDLIPTSISSASPYAGEVAEAEQLDTAITVLVELLLEVNRLRSHAMELKSENKKLTKKRKKLKLRLAEAVTG